jgi:hypothetical protein
LPPMTPPPPPHAPQLPSRRVSAALTALMLAAGIALGALIGPGPAASLSSTSRAAAVGRVLALLALGGGTGSGSGLLLSSGAAHPPASSPQPTPPATSEATTGTGGGGGGAGKAAGSSSSGSSTAPSSGSASPTSSTTPTAGGGEGEKTKTPAPLPPIANVWLVVLPYGGSLENALKQGAAAPYLDGQLAGQSTALEDYSSLAAGQLAGAATLLSGQVNASVSTIAPPTCAPAANGTGATPGTASSPATSAPGAAPGQATTSAPCPLGEPAGVQAADAYLQEVVPKIMASATYREHGLIVITFAPSGQAGTPTSAATTPTSATTAPAAGSTEAAGAGVAYPAGSLTSTLTAEGSPAGALLISPFLRHVGTRSSNAFNPTSPRVSLEALFKPKAAGA